MATGADVPAQITRERASCVVRAVNSGGVMVDTVTELETARAAFERGDWGQARERFQAARDRGALSADDLGALAEAAWWSGAIDESLNALEEAYRRYRQEARPRRAAMSAVFLSIYNMNKGDMAIGSGWMGRAQRLLRDEPECAVHGYPLYFEIFTAIAHGDLDDAIADARRMQEIGRRFRDPNLLAVGMVGEGRAMVAQGRADEGMALVDEAMLTAFSDGLHPLWTGAVYRHLMNTCHELADLKRAAEWTQVAAQWCDGLPEAMLYRGICRIHRAQLLRMQGRWELAEREAARAGANATRVHVGVGAQAHYEVGEVRRLRGDLTGAEEAFLRAHELGHDPQPGLALLRLDQGRLEAASASIQAALIAETRGRLARARLYIAQIEIALAAGDLDTAGTACAELCAAAAAYSGSGLRAEVEQSVGAVLLAAGKAEEALGVLRAACRLWRELGAPYGIARTRTLVAEAYRTIGDEDAAELEFDAAREGFDRLGASLDARRLSGIRTRAPLPAGLTEREAEVLRHVAAGNSNRQVAALLCLSEKTVARHLSNIFTKLGLSSRTAAAGYAFEHGIATPPRT